MTKTNNTKKRISKKTTSEEISIPEKISSGKKSGFPISISIFTIAILFIITLLYFFKGLFIAAIVNGQPISRLAIIKELEKQGGKKILDLAITKKLIMQEAKNKKVVIDQKDIDAQLKGIETNVKKQGKTLDQALKSEGINKSDLVEDIRIQLIAQKLAGNVNPTENEINEYIKNNQEQIPEGLSQETIKEQAVQQIKQQKLQQKIQELIQKLREKAGISYFVQY